MGSSISTAQGVVFARLTASSGLAAASPRPAVQVTYGPPDAHEDQEVVALFGVRNPEEEPVSLGAGGKDETYQLEVKVKAHDPAGTAQEVNDRGWAIADVVVDEIEGSGDYTLDDTVMWALCEPTTTEGVRPAQGGGWVIFLTVLITCRARISRRSA